VQLLFLAHMAFRGRQRSGSSSIGTVWFPKQLMSAMGRFLPVVTVWEFSYLATCYAEFNGRVRPGAVIHDLRNAGENRYRTRNIR
jgi:hypothetical protein